MDRGPDRQRRGKLHRTDKRSVPPEAGPASPSVRPTSSRFDERSEASESEYGRDGKRGERDLDADTGGVGMYRTRQFEKIALSDLAEAVLVPLSTLTASSSTELRGNIYSPLPFVK